MQQHSQDKQDLGLVRPAIAGSLLAYAAVQFGPGQPHDPAWVDYLYWGLWGLSGFYGFHAGKAVFRITRETAKYAKALKGAGIKGAAAFMTRKEAREAGLTNWRRGMPLGLLDGRPIAAHTETHALVNGPAGSGKSVCFFFPLLMHRENACLVMDPKGEGYEVAGPVRRARMGRTVKKLDPLDPNSAQINPIDLIAEKLSNDDPQALNIARIYAHQLHPEPEAEGQNKFFRIGARRILTVLMLVAAVIWGPDKANLANIYRLVVDEDALNAALMQAVSCKLLNGEIAAMAEELHRMAFGNGGAAKTYEQFRLGAMNSLEMFGPGSELAWITARSTISFKDLKDPGKKLDLFVTSGPNHQESFAPWMGLMFRQAAYELVEARSNAPVDFVMEEFTNAPVYELPRILTLLRSYGVRCTMIVQDIQDIARVYGEKAMETVLSESSVKVFLSVRSQGTCELVSKMLGDTEHVGWNFGIDETIRPSTTLESAPLLRPDEIRQLPSHQAIVIQKDLKPALIEKVGYHEARPWASKAGTNSMMGGKLFKGSAKLRLLYPGPWLVLGPWRWKKPAAAKPSVLRPVLWFGLMRSGLLATALACAGAVYAVDTFGLPHIRVEQGYTRCTYFGPSPGLTAWRERQSCPLIILKRSW